MKGNNDANETMKYLLNCGPNQDKFELSKLAVEANLIGAVFHTRSLWDHFAQLVNTLLLDNDISVGSVTIQNVTKKLEVNHSKHENIKQALDYLIQSYWYEYIESFTNTIKHRQLVEMEFKVSNRWDGFHFTPFDHNGKCFDEKNCIEVHDGVIEVCNHIVNCGSELNIAYGN